MKKFTSIKVGGLRTGLLFPRDVDELKKLVLYARKKAIPTMILGKGTNVIVTDRGFRGWMISLDPGLLKFEEG